MEEVPSVGGTRMIDEIRRDETTGTPAIEVSRTKEIPATGVTKTLEMLVTWVTKTLEMLVTAVSKTTELPSTGGTRTMRLPTKWKVSRLSSVARKYEALESHKTTDLVIKKIIV